MRVPLNRKETVMRHASPPSKKRKPAKLGCSSFEEAQHPVVSDRWFRRSLCDLCRVHLFCSLVCFLQTRCRAALAQRICGFDWRCVALRTCAGLLVRMSQGARLFLLVASQGVARSTREGCERETRDADGLLVSVVSSSRWCTHVLSRSPRLSLAPPASALVLARETMCWR